MSDTAPADPLDLRKVEARAWFEQLRDRIHAIGLHRPVGQNMFLEYDVPNRLGSTRIPGCRFVHGVGRQGQLQAVPRHAVVQPIVREQHKQRVSESLLGGNGGAGFALGCLVQRHQRRNQRQVVHRPLVHRNSTSPESGLRQVVSQTLLP